MTLLRFGFAVAGTLFLFTRRLGDAQLVEIVLHFVGHDFFAEIESVLFIFHLHFLAAREDFVTSMLFVPLGERGSHVHLLDDVAPSHAGVVGAEADLAFLRGVRDDALLGAAEVVVEQILEPHSRDKQEVPAILTALHDVVNRAVRTDLAVVLAGGVEVLVELL